MIPISYHEREHVPVGQLEEDVKQLHKKKVYLESEVSNLESLDNIGSMALEKYSLRLPHPKQIIWLAVADNPEGGGDSTLDRLIARLGSLHAGLQIPLPVSSSASAEEGTAR